MKKRILTILFLVFSFGATTAFAQKPLEEQLVGQWGAAEEDFTLKSESVTRLFFGPLNTDKTGSYVQYNSANSILKGTYEILLRDKKTQTLVVRITYENNSIKTESYKFSGGGRNIEQLMNFDDYDIVTYLTFVNSKTRP